MSKVLLSQNTSCQLYPWHNNRSHSLQNYPINPDTGRNSVFPYFVNSTETGSCLYPSRFRAAETWWSSFPWTGRVSVMFPRRKRTIMFPPHFCYHISVLSCFRYVSGFLTHAQKRRINVSETFSLRTIKVNKGKFTLEIGPLNGSNALLARVALMQRLWSVRGCHCFRFWVIKIAELTNSFRYLPDWCQSVPA